MGGEKGRDEKERRGNGAMEGAGGESGCLITVGYKSLMYCTIAVLFPRQDPGHAAK